MSSIKYKTYNKIQTRNKSKTRTRSRTRQQTKTKKPLQPPTPINGSSRRDESGVIKLKLIGTAYEIGYAHGRLLKNEISEMMSMYRFHIPYLYGRPLSFFVKLACDFFLPVVKRRYPEIYREMKGIAHGSGTPVQHILFINSSLSLESLYMNLSAVLQTSSPRIQQRYRNFLSSSSTSSSSSSSKKSNYTIEPNERCTAFIATGSYTKDGNIVCAHNTNGRYIETQYFNVVAEVRPKTGYAFTMQTAPGYIFSGTDIFVTSAGIIGTETTIKHFKAYELRDPIFCRIRKCMQYGDTLDDYIETLLANNSGDYACTWLFGSIKTKEIVSLELGLKYHNLQRTKDGIFIGTNAAYDARIRNLECSDDAARLHGDIRTSNWARHVRLTNLIATYRGQLNVVIGSKILADHYDSYLKKVNASARSICKHCELDDCENSADPELAPFIPVGTVDAAVVDATIASQLSFLFRFGSSCGKPFNKKEYFLKNPQWQELYAYIKDRPSQPWIKV
jgi:hypothetical protein